MGAQLVSLGMFAPGSGKPAKHLPHPSSELRVSQIKGLHALSSWVCEHLHIHQQISVDIGIWRWHQPGKDVDSKGPGLGFSTLAHNGA